MLAVPDALTFWTSAVFDSSRIGSDSVPASQSLRAFTLREFGDSALSTAAWLLLVVLVLGALAVAVRWATGKDNQALVLSLTGVGACLISPFSWHHHWVWIVPLAVCLVDGGARAGRALADRRRYPLTAWMAHQATTAVALVAVAVATLTYVSHRISVGWSFIGQAGRAGPAGELWVLWGCALIVIGAVPALVERHRARAPAARRMPGATPRVCVNP